MIKLNQNSKIVLNKIKNLLNITKEILAKNNISSKYHFWLPNFNTFSSTEMQIINSHFSTIIYNKNQLNKEDKIMILLNKALSMKSCGKNVLIICFSNLIYTVLNQKFEKSFKIYKFNQLSNLNIKIYDEIILLGEWKVENLDYIKENNINISFMINDEKYFNIFDNNKIFELDEFSFPSYVIFDFARQFLPKDSCFNSVDFIEKLKNRNSGADEPYFYETKDLKSTIEFIKDILDEHPIDNIGIFLPFGNDKENFDLSVENYYKILKKYYSCSKYYNGLEIDNLHNIIITTFDDWDYLTFDVVIIPNFDIVKKKISQDKIFRTLISANNQLYIINERK